MKRLIVASNNAHKIEEIKDILSKFSFDVVSIKEAGVDIDIVEDGETFIDNAVIKAKAIKEIFNDDFVLSDDSGLMVDALGGAPGVFSARYAGEHGNSEKNNEKLLREMNGVPEEERGAQFVCAMCFIDDKGEVINVQGEVRGRIIEEYRGGSGFGYDPLFFVPEKGMTFAEMGAEEKNSMSHRSRALEKLSNVLMEKK
ncbi:XTP/dITP diphosphatase [Oceanirhabdus sp. W0125-5]|uniref:XTP/dITP diphosphatase n=1 Tax=Oceanirhabdus sp. W0125-5 TaxID=2999116 RepID=UPI0022F30FCB|nr:XTP/dITP diphosphatase [Oceanirhabdus sp. W0125-5]WBW98826.1 XTP/dITP diphosphatase [Oceanirhabdus sp. W0125-5]